MLLLCTFTDMLARLCRLAPLLALVFLSAPAHPQSLFERLVLPGDLIEGHADLQKDCSNCHENFSRGAQDNLCLDCHKPLAADIREKTGFHGRAPLAGANGCNQCHTDHIGRSANIVPLDTEVFDHDQTDFTLRGTHARTPCTACHAAGKKFREAPGQCVDCHEKDEPHNGALGRECADCHRATDWATLRDFDHSQTRFPLQNSHIAVACAACHVGETYVGLPRTCAGCHRIQDIHQNRFGPRCESCHVSTRWSQIRFDHNRDTDFTLTGKHVQAGCNSCHGANVSDHPAPTTCVGCHRADDPHKGTLGARCGTCHTTEGWHSDVAFDHDLARFPLIGLHLLVACDSCHVTSNFTDVGMDCLSCHRADDAHKGRLGADCETCHNPNGWEFWLFDHNRQTRFTLTGAHSGLKCESCHRPTGPVSLRGSTACISCHARDDKHRGEFGRQCGLCHTTTSFRGARLR